LDVHDRLDHRVDLALDVVRLVDHEGGRFGRLGRFPIDAGGGDFAHDPEELEGVDRADDQVVVRVLPVVEVEAAEQALGEQERHDLLDVRPLRMVACVHQHLRLGAEAPADECRRSPVRKIGAVERRLEELVLDQESHTARQRCIEVCERREEPAETGAEVVLAGIVRAVREPEAEL
jgi:hypothetical protein